MFAAFARSEASSHSMTSSARPSSGSDTLMPKVLAQILELIDCRDTGLQSWYS
jgi:hypothetical protein